MKNNLIEIAYTSHSLHLNEQQLNLILEQARTFNKNHNITGLLLYKDGSFLQILEGNPETLEPLYLKIRLDSRHLNVKTLYHQPLLERNFSGWAMMFHDISIFEKDGVTLKAPLPEGLIPFDSPSSAFDDWVKPSAAKLLIEAFRHHA